MFCTNGISTQIEKNPTSVFFVLVTKYGNRMMQLKHQQILHSNTHKNSKQTIVCYFCIFCHELNVQKLPKFRF